MRRTPLASAYSLVVALLLVGCAESLPRKVVDSLQSAQEQDLLIYTMPVDGGSPSRALSRGAYCSVDSVLGYYNAPSFDAGGAIVCKGKKP